jgi:hypothetical protein
MQKITKKAARYELLAMKVGDVSFGNTKLLAELSLDELKTIEWIAKSFKSDGTGVLLDAIKGSVDLWASEESRKTGRMRQ